MAAAEVGTVQKCLPAVAEVCAVLVAAETAEHEHIYSGDLPKENEVADEEGEVKNQTKEYTHLQILVRQRKAEIEAQPLLLCERRQLPSIFSCFRCTQRFVAAMCEYVREHDRRHRLLSNRFEPGQPIPSLISATVVVPSVGRRTVEQLVSVKVGNYVGSNCEFGISD